MAKLEDIEKLKKKDPVFLSALVDEYTDYLYFISYKKGFTKEQAEELVQNVWARFFASIDRFEGKSSIKTYLLGIYFNVYKEEVRGLAKDRLQDPIDEMFETQFDETGHWYQTPKSPDTEVWRNELSVSIKACIDSLEIKYRDAFLLREIGGESTEDICNILQVQRTHLGVLLFRARAYLKQCLEGKM